MKLGHEKRLDYSTAIGSCIPILIHFILILFQNFLFNFIFVDFKAYYDLYGTYVLILIGALRFFDTELILMTRTKHHV